MTNVSPLTPSFLIRDKLNEKSQCEIILLKKDFFLICFSSFGGSDSSFQIAIIPPPIQIIALMTFHEIKVIFHSSSTVIMRIMHELFHIEPIYKSQAALVGIPALEMKLERFLVERTLQ